MGMTFGVDVGYPTTGIYDINGLYWQQFLNERSVKMVPLYSFARVSIRTISVNLFTLAVGMTFVTCK
jgi:hypothetical protein